MWIVNQIMSALVGGLLYPFRGMPALVGLTVASLVCGVAMLWVFKRTSDQDRLEETKRQIHAGIFEIRLFNDDMRAIFRAQADILRHNLTYFRLSLVPMLWMIVPLALVLIQLQFHYGWEGPRPGEPVLLKVAMRDAGRGPAEPASAGPTSPGLRLEVPGGVRVDSPMLWIPSTGEADFRLVVEEPGDHEIGIVIDGQTLTTRLVASPDLAPRSPIRPSGAFTDQLLWPTEPPIPADSRVASIEITHPERSVWFLGWETHWLVVFFILTIVIAFALRKPMGVTI